MRTAFVWAITALSVANAQEEASAPLTVSPNGRCGGYTGYTCIDSSYGECCSQYGWW